MACTHTSASFAKRRHASIFYLSWRHVCQRHSWRPGHGRTLVFVPCAKGDSNQIRKYVSYSLSHLSSLFLLPPFSVMLCCGLFPLCSLDACVSASLCSRRMLLHEQLNRAWHACDQCARFDCRSARHCWRSTPFCMCSHPLLTSHDYSPCDTSISILYNMHANIMRALIVDLYATVGAQLHSACAVIHS